ncbi:MAG TPA: hypothetical protein VMT30_05380 [Candidatus Saccharimonadia bacterium]|nr:hypothetical protein [Candidatus Saccharimonadia bacterium]
MLLLASTYAALNRGGSDQNSAITCGKATVHAPALVGDVATRYCGTPRAKLAVTPRTNPGRKLRNSCVTLGDGTLAPATTYCFPDMTGFKAVFAVVPANATRVDLTVVPQYFVQRIGTVDWIVALGTTSYLVRAPSGRAPLTPGTIRVWRWSGTAWVPSSPPKLQGVTTVRNDFDVFFRQIT